MKLIIYSSILILVLLITSCVNKKEKTITLSQPDTIHLTELSSASGIGFFNQTNYIVGDDSPWLYELDNDLNIISKTQISTNIKLVNGRTPKKFKADFEGAEIINDDDSIKLVVISSGSSSVTRDTAFIVNLSNSGNIVKRNIRPLYEKIKLKAGLPSTNEINIEGIAFSMDNAYLFHRGNVSENIIIKIDRYSFVGYLKNGNPIPDFNIYIFNLPSYKGIVSGFSGACIIPDNSGLLFTASMEDTKNEIDDGKVLGSFVGIIPLSSMEKGEYIASLVLDNNAVMEKKIEGISIRSISKNGQINVITVCDNDDGTSDIIRFSLNIN